MMAGPCDSIGRKRRCRLQRCPPWLIFLFLAVPAVVTIAAGTIHVTHAEPTSSTNRQSYTSEFDPFVPFIILPPKDEISPGGAVGGTELEEGRVFKTPFERIALQEIRLVGIVVSAEKKMAVVEDRAGKFYDLFPGTAVGVNEGKVVEIGEDHVVIVEKERDIDGRVKEQRRILRME